MSTKSATERVKVKKKMSKAQMQLALIKKKQCDATALIIVEKLLEPIVEPQWLLQNLKHINKSHLEDVIEERAIVKLCGYVLCKNPITVVFKQQYHISTKSNKVYDISRRKNFCSSACYGASNYLLEQMLTSPLWMRENEEIPVFKLLPLNLFSSKSKPGDEVFVIDPELQINNDKDTKTIEGNNSGIVNVNKYQETKKSLPKSSLPDNEQLEIPSELKSVVDHNVIKSTENNEHNDNQCTQTSTAQECKQGNESFVEEKINEKSNDQQPTQLKIPAGDEPLVNKLSQDKEPAESKETNVNKEQMNIVENTLNEKLPVDPVLESTELQTPVKQEESVNEFKLNVSDDHTQLNLIKNNQGLVPSNESDGKREVKMQKHQHDERRKKEKKSSDSKKTTLVYFSLAMRVEQSVKEWVTDQTLCLLQGEPDAKNHLLEAITQRDRYQQLCKKLNRIQLEDEREDRTELAKDSLKPLPHFSVLQEEGKKMELKVSAFYKGSMVTKLPQNDEKDETSKEEDNTVLPLTDAHDARALRRRIFLDKLNKILPELMRTLSGNTKSYPATYCTYDSDRVTIVKALVTTFSLSATNIVFKAAEWTLVGLIIMKMLSVMDYRLKSLLATKRASLHISMILMSYKLDENYLDRLIIELTNDPNVFNSNFQT